MKTIATIAASLLLSLGLLISPAAAEEPAPAPTCEETVQEWRTRALVAEAELEVTRTALSRQVDLFLIERANVEQASKSVYRMVRIAERRRLKLEEMRATIRGLRRELRSQNR